MSATLTRPEDVAVPAAPRRAATPAASGRLAGLDGLRALAILGVLVFHLQSAWLPGGYLGVDVFFVISGFLITTLLVREYAKAGRINFGSFWIRRARRLLPALVVCVVVSSLIARMVSSDLVVDLPRQVLGAATFSTNWMEIFANSSYFDQTAPILFMNFWSLAVEEQFYLFWPLVAFALIKALRPTLRPLVPAAAALVSTVLMLVLFAPGADPTRIYYGTDTHLMGLMVGAALAFAWASPLHARMADWLADHQWIGPAALTALFLLMLLMSEGSALTFRGGLLLTSLVTGALVLATISRADGHGLPLEQTVWQRILDAPAATWIGERSYSLYLWHWPVILIFDQAWATAPDTWQFVVRSLLIVVITGALAEASLRFIETPIRKVGYRVTGRRTLAWLRRQSRPRLRALSAGSVVTALCLVATLATAPAESSTARVLQQNAAEAAAGGSSTPAPSASVSSGTPTPTPTPTPLKQDWSMPSGDEIDGFGDSIMVGSVPALNLYFPGIRLDAVSNRHLSDGIKAIEGRSNIRRAVVFDFGMNAGLDATELDHALSSLGPERMVVVVNLYGTFSRAKADNETIAHAVAGRDNMIVADWYSTARNNPGALQSDKQHPSLRGSHLYAQVVQSAFAELSKRHTGKPVELKTHPLPAR